MRRIVALFCLIYSLCPLFSKTVYDYEGCSIIDLFSNKNTKYIIQYNHHFIDTIIIPRGSELHFDGGSLVGPIVFDDTKLSGFVNLKGSSIRGRVKNKYIDASWLCYLDGVNDDAPLINQLIGVCNTVFFPKGYYRLISRYSPDDLKKEYYKNAIHSHIGINKNNVTLIGEEGTVFVTDEPCGVITIYSKPYDIEGTVENIKIENISFRIKNNGEDFYESMYVIETIGVNRLVIEKCYFDDFLGDAICLSHYGDDLSTKERTRNQNVSIINNIIVGGGHYNTRNGISVINGKNVLIKNNVIKNTSRKDMPGGIDVEPNNSAYTIENIRIEDNYLEGIKGGGGAICVVSPKGGPAYNITIRNNTVKNSKTGIFVYIKSDNTTNTFVIEGNKIDNHTRPYRFEGDGISNNWKIRNNSFEKPCKQVIPGDIHVNNLLVRDNEEKRSL